jgi:CCR4-NOT transcription complex subunit 3
MERFKALEKEMKTKAFSKEGLQAATRLDPASKLKLDARHSLEEFVDSLSRQIEQSEAEIELLHAAAASGGKKKSRAAQAAAAAAGNGGGDKAGELERLNERRQWHVGKLEAVMRMLDNGRLSVDQVNDLKEDVAYFVESNQVRRWEGVVWRHRWLRISASPVDGTCPASPLPGRGL